MDRRPPTVPLILLSVLTWIIVPSAFGGTSITHVTNSLEAFEACTRDTRIDVTTSRGIVKLAPIEYIVHDIGNHIQYTGFDKKRVGKKVFLLETVAAAKAELFVFTGSGKATFNGKAIEFKALGYGGWTRAQVSANLLRQGANELVLESGFRMAMDLDKAPPAHSFFSADAGKTWGPADGEFLVHLRVHQHPAQGVITSGVIDLAGTNGRDVIRPSINVKRVTIRARTTMPKGTLVQIEARTGHSVLPDNSGQWTGWTIADELEPRQYVQWRAILATTDRTRSPVIKSVTVEADVDVLADAKTHDLKLKAFDNQHIVRSSWDFTFQPPSSKLAELRRRWNLDDVVAPGKTEMEKLVLLRNWVRRQWPHNDAGSGTRTWDAIEILSAPPNQKGMCVHFGVAFTQCALSLGYNARQVILNGHYVSEAWSNEHRKWVLMDVETVNSEGWDRYGSAHYVDVNTNQPMSALDLHRALQNKQTSNIVQKLYMTDEPGKPGRHRLYERTYGPKGYSPFQRFAYPPRNNYLDQLEPWEQFHGFDHYHSEAHLWWKNDPLSHTPEYSWQTNREGDISWTVNQVQIFAYCTRSPDKVKLRFDTNMPNLAHLAYRIGEGAWQELNGRGAITELDWPLSPGDNKFEIKPVNTFGRDGITSTLVIQK